MLPQPSATGPHEAFAWVHVRFVHAPPLPGRQPFAADRFSLGARILHFPDVAAIEPQPWVPRDVAGWTSMQWDLRNAFVSVETLVDDIVGEKGVYDDVIASVKEDPDGPQIDIEKDLVAALGSRVTLITDHAVPIDTDSERLVIAVETVDPERVAATVAKSMSIDPDMAKVDVQGHVAWELIDRSSAIPKLEVETPGGAVPHADHDDDRSRRTKLREREEKLLPHSVVTVAHGHLLVASHRDILERVKALGRVVGGAGSLLTGLKQEGAERPIDPDWLQGRLFRTPFNLRRGSLLELYETELQHLGTLCTHLGQQGEALLVQYL